MSTLSIIGAGNMARAIAIRALAGGNRVQLVAQDKGKADVLAAELTGEVSAGTVGDPLSGELVVLAVPYDAATPLVTQYADQLDGKVVVDITNPVDWASFDRLVVPGDSSGAEEIAKAAPSGARVVKAFNTTFAGTLAAGQVAGQPLDVATRARRLPAHGAAGAAGHRLWQRTALPCLNLSGSGWFVPAIRADVAVSFEGRWHRRLLRR